MSLARKATVFGSPSLEDLRAQIDQVDMELVALLERRAGLVFAVGDLKRQRALPIHDPEREVQIKAKVQKLTSPEGPLTPAEMSACFMTLVERFRTLESAHVHMARAIELVPRSGLDFAKAQHLVIWGFGLLGSSFYLALNEKLPHWKFSVVDPEIDRSSFLKWRKERQLTNIVLGDEGCLAEADVVVLGAPVEINNCHLADADFPEGALVFDLGSTKQATEGQFLKRLRTSGASFTFIGGHPLAGKELVGFQNGDPLLFHNKVFCWVAPPGQGVNESLRATFDILALHLGARPLWVSAAAHDQALAWTSHLPQLLSATLAGLLLRKEFSREADYFPGYITELLRTSGSPFSRWQSIYGSNSEAVEAALTELIHALTDLRSRWNNPSAGADLFDQANEFYNYFQLEKRKKG